MAKFSLRKGERFSLSKGEGLENLTVSLGWKSGADLDVCAFLLGRDGCILNDADFVYYKSNNREAEFDIEIYGNKRKWREATRPMSADGSVMGSLDDLGDEDEGEDAGEEMNVNLNKVNGKICQILFCVTIYTEGVSFGDVHAPFISIINDEDGEELCRYELNEHFKNETAVVAGGLVCDEEGDWSFEAIGKGYIGGMQSLIDIYADE